MTVLPAASAAATPPHGMAMGKFHGDTTTTTPLRPRLQRRHLLPPARGVAIELQEIDRLGDFGVGLGQRLAAIGQRGAHEVGARLAELLRHLAEQVESLRDWHGPPAVRVGGGAVHGARDVGLAWPGDNGPPPRRAATDRGSRAPSGPSSISSPAITSGICGRCAAARLPLRDDLLRPLAVLRQRKIGVGLVFEDAASRGRCAGVATGGRLPVLRAARRIARRGDRVERGEEALLQLLPLGAADLDFEGVAQEVLRPGVFVQPADQVADGVDEILLLAGRRVEQQIAATARTARGAGGWPCLRASRTAPCPSRCARAPAPGRRPDRRGCATRRPRPSPPGSPAS